MRAEKSNLPHFRVENLMPNDSVKAMIEEDKIGYVRKQFAEMYDAIDLAHLYTLNTFGSMNIDEMCNIKKLLIFVIKNCPQAAVKFAVHMTKGFSRRHYIGNGSTNNVNRKTFDTDSRSSRFY